MKKRKISCRFCGYKDYNTNLLNQKILKDPNGTVIKCPNKECENPVIMRITGAKHIECHGDIFVHLK